MINNSESVVMEGYHFVWNILLISTYFSDRISEERVKYCHLKIVLSERTTSI